jgi:hypothetical protein
MHQPGVAAENDADTCTMRSTSAPTDAALLSLTGGLGVPSTASPLDLPRGFDRLGSGVVAPADRAILPDSPPPRA